jgi:hypothetical protein
MIALLGTLDRLRIFNMAIGEVGGTRMTTLGDTHTESILLNEAWPSILDEVLAALDWSFARAVVSVPKTTDPNGLSRSVYAAPSDAVAVWQVGEDQECDNEDEWKFENGLIYLPDGGPDPLYIRYTTRVSDTLRFNATFVPAIVSRLAVLLTIPVTQNKELYITKYKVYGGLIMAAKRTDGVQGKNQPKRQGSMIRVRR